MVFYFILRCFKIFFRGTFCFDLGRRFINTLVNYHANFHATVVHFQCTWVGYYLIKSSYVIYQKKKKKNYHAKFGTFLLQNERQKKSGSFISTSILNIFFFFNLGFPLGAPITYQFKKIKIKKIKINEGLIVL